MGLKFNPLTQLGFNNTGSGGGGGGTDELSKVSANDTTADFLLSKIVAGTGITINELNDGANETLEIVASGSGANTNLSNLASPTAINQDLIPSGTRRLGASGSAWNTLYSLVVRTGSGSNLQVFTDQQSGGSGNLLMSSGATTGVVASPTGIIRLKTGDITNAGASGDTGDVEIITGANSGSGGQGDILFQDGSEGTTGHVWTSKGTLGEGNWEASSGDVAGPGSSTNLAVPVFSGTTGKIIANTGVVIDGNDLIVTTGNAASPSLRMNSSNSGIYRSSSSGTGISAGGTEVFKFEASGHVSSKLIEPVTDLTGALTLGSASKRWWQVYSNGATLNNITADSGTMNFNFDTVTYNPNNSRKEVTDTEVSTTDATITNLFTKTVTTSTTYALTVKVTASRTGGASGTDGDSAFYWKTTLIKVNSGGTITTSTPVVLAEIEDQAGWDLIIDDDGATDVRVRVTGAASNNIDWKGEVELLVN